MTSNIAPVNLYKDGLQRERFVPFIDLITQRFTTIHFTGQVDYRAGKLQAFKRYLHPVSAETADVMDQAFQEALDGQVPAPTTIENKGRLIRFDTATDDALCTDFETLCGQALGAGDYLAIANRFHIILIKGVPRLDDTTPNEVKRFITLIDAFYERQRLVFIQAETPLPALYSDKRYQTAFARTESRLMEMSAPQYP
jgi:cell division protein ZapE